MEKNQQRDSSCKSNNSNCSTKNNVSPATKPGYGRYCHIVKRPDFDGYGFNLHSEKIKPGQYIGKVDPDSPAEAAGLREGDQIIEVNGVNIGTETHKQVVQRIKAISNEVRLLLIDPNKESAANFNKTPSTNVDEKNSTKTNNNSNNNKHLTPTMSPKIDAQIPNATATGATSSSTITIVPMTTAETASENLKDEVTSTKSNYSNNDETIDVTDFNTAEGVVNVNNGHHTTAIANGKSSEQATSKVPLEVATTTLLPMQQQQQPTEQQMIDTSSNKSSMSSSQNTDNSSSTQTKPGLNLNLTAAEMRAKLLAKKKFDPKNDSVDLKKKFDIIQKL